jgi:transcriptional regulator with XRE-family HTH domain
MRSHPVDAYVGKRLRLRRTMQGMSQDALGKMIGVTFQQIQKYEKGVNRIGSSRLYHFAKALSIPISYFFEGYEDDGFAKLPEIEIEGLAEETAEDFEHDQLTSRETLEMVRYYYRIGSKQQRKRVFELIKSMANEKE